MHDNEDDLTPDEQLALAALSREMQPSDLLESRVVRALKSEGYLGAARTRTNRGIALAWRTAAAIALFTGGVATGRYLIAADSTQTATITSPSKILRNSDTAGSGTTSRQVRPPETMVAEREMWL